jgi:hypothetical protein
MKTLPVKVIPSATYVCTCGHWLRNREPGLVRIDLPYLDVSCFNENCERKGITVRIRYEHIECEIHSRWARLWSRLWRRDEQRGKTERAA